MKCSCLKDKLHCCYYFRTNKFLLNLSCRCLFRKNGILLYVYFFTPTMLTFLLSVVHAFSKISRCHSDSHIFFLRKIIWLCLFLVFVLPNNIFIKRCLPFCVLCAVIFDTESRPELSSRQYAIKLIGSIAQCLIKYSCFVKTMFMFVGGICRYAVCPRRIIQPTNFLYRLHRVFELAAS